MLCYVYREIARECRKPIEKRTEPETNEHSESIRAEIGKLCMTKILNARQIVI